MLISDPVTISQPDAGLSQANVALSQCDAVDFSQPTVASSQSLAIDLSQSTVEPATSTSHYTVTAVQSDSEKVQRDADDDVDDKIVATKKTPAKRGRKRKAPVVTTEEDPEYFISYCFSNDNDKNNPIACRNRWGVFFYFDWPFVCDISTPSGDNLIQDFDFFEPSRKSAALSCLYPFIDLKDVEYWKRVDGSEFYLNIWTKDRPSELQNLQEPKLFLKRRQQFLQTWAKKLWILEDGSYLVHLNSAIEDMAEFDRLILGHGFLKFSKTCLEKSLNPQQRALRLEHSATNYPWKSGDEALQWLDPKNDVVFAKENWFRRPNDQLRVTKMTLADLCAHLERHKPKIIERARRVGGHGAGARHADDVV